MCPLLFPEPLTVVHHSSLRVLAVIHEAYRRGQVLTVRDVCRRLGWTSPNAAARHLRRLRRLGLVRWEDLHARTLVPTCEFVPAGRLSRED